LENGARQALTQDAAQQEVSGFSIRRARIAVEDSLGPLPAEYRIEVQLEKSVRLADCYLAIRAPVAEVWVGQMKIPSTYEVAMPTTGLDFVDPATITDQIAEWALARSPRDLNLMGVRANQRDLGVGLKGQVRDGRLRYFLMVGNGLGAALFVGGKEDRQFLYANGLGQQFYGVRLDLRPRPWLGLGGHGSVNHHANSLLSDGKTVVDIDRAAWSTDLGLDLPAGLRARALYGAGVIDDEYVRDGRRDYEYSGWETRVLGWLARDRLEAGLRFDRYEYRENQVGPRTCESHWTAGLNGYLPPGLRAQLNYVRKDTRSPSVPDPADDALLAQLQVAF
jgi:hypothetical protein